MTERFIPPATQFPNYAQQIADRLDGNDRAIQELAALAKETLETNRKLIQLQETLVSAIAGLREEVEALKTRP